MTGTTGDGVGTTLGATAGAGTTDGTHLTGPGPGIGAGAADGMTLGTTQAITIHITTLITATDLAGTTITITPLLADTIPEEADAMIAEESTAHLALLQEAPQQLPEPWAVPTGEPLQSAMYAPLQSAGAIPPETTQRLEETLPQAAMQLSTGILPATATLP